MKTKIRNDGRVKYWDVFKQQWNTKLALDLLTAQSGSGNYLMPTFSARERERIISAAELWYTNLKIELKNIMNKNS